MFWVEALCVAAFLISLSGCGSTECTDCETLGSPEPSPDPNPVSPSSNDSDDDAPAVATQSYADCVTQDLRCGVGRDPHCLVDDIERPTVGVCTSYCLNGSECPPSGTADFKCFVLGEEQGECVLDCIDGQACPSGMICLPHGICGYATEAAVNPYGECGQCADDSLGCWNVAGGSACVPRFNGERCPAPREGGAVPVPVNVEGSAGCVLSCEMFQRCPLGMECLPFGLDSICAWVSEPDCSDVDCRHDSECQVLDGRAQCVCPDGSPADEAFDCGCANVECHPSAECRATEDGAVCVCDGDETMEPDGRCVENDPDPQQDPCEPNPCEGPRSYCIVDGDEFRCECDAKDQSVECLDECAAVHDDGDSLEPNECELLATVLQEGAAEQGPQTTLAELSPTEDDVDYYRLPQQGGTYWLLLDSEEPMCELPFFRFDQAMDSGIFEFGLELPAETVSGAFRCARQDGQDDLDYSLGLLHFPTTVDLPAEANRLEGRRSIADLFNGADDVDAFEFVTTSPREIRFSGQAATMTVQASWPDGSVESATVECEFSLEPATCLRIEGQRPNQDESPPESFELSEDIVVVVSVTLRRSDAAELPPFNAWHVSF